MKRLLIGASAFAVAFSAALLTPLSAYAHEGPDASATHPRLIANRDALHFLRELPPAGISDSSPLLGNYSAEDRAALKEMVHTQIIAGVGEPNAQAQKIHAWIVANVRPARDGEVAAFTPAEVLAKRVASARGYSNLYKAMLDVAGIPNALVTGTVQQTPHQWNILFIGGEYFHSDAALGTGYFRKSLEDFSADHATDTIHDVTVADGPYRYGYAQGVALKGVSDVERAKTLEVPSLLKDMPVVALSHELFSSQGLESITLPASITRVDTHAGTGTLTCFHVAEGNTHLSDHECALFSADRTRLIAYPIAARATSFTLPQATTSFDEKIAFAAPALKTLKVHADNPTYASYEGALYTKDFSSLRAIPGGMTRLVVNGKAVLAQDSIAQRLALTTVVLEEGITAVPVQSFNILPSLRQVIFPETVSAVAPDAFAYVDVPKVTLVGKKGSLIETYANERGFRFSESAADISDPSTGTGTDAPSTPPSGQSPDTPEQPKAPGADGSAGSAGTTPGPAAPSEPPATPDTPSTPEKPSTPENPPAPEPPAGADTTLPAPQAPSTPEPSTPGTNAGTGNAQDRINEALSNAGSSNLQSAINAWENGLETLTVPPAQLPPAENSPLKKPETPNAPSTLESTVVEGKINPAELGAGIEKIGLTTDLTLSPGATMTVVASGYASNEVVTFVMNAGSKTMGLVRADSMGIAKVTWTIPNDFTPGEHTVLAIGTTGKTLKMPVKVAAYPDLKKSPVSAVKPSSTQPPSVDLLAETGAHVAKAVAIFALCVGAGVTVLILRRPDDTSSS